MLDAPGQRQAAILLARVSQIGITAGNKFFRLLPLQMRYSPAQALAASRLLK